MKTLQGIRKLPLSWLLLWFGAALLASIVFPGTIDPNLSRSLQAPEWGHFLGFDPFGRDLQQILLQASLRSALFAAASVLLSTAIALCLGASIVLLPSQIQFLALRALDTSLAFPSLLLALAWAAIRGPGWGTLFVSLLIGIFPPFARLLYVRAREIVTEPYILAAVGLGASPGRILFRHLIPALGSVCSVKIPIIFAQALMAEATLSFLGVGAPIGKETWGALLFTGKEYLFEAPHIAIAAGIPLTLTVLSLQVLGSRKPWLSAGKSVS